MKDISDISKPSNTLQRGIAKRLIISLTLGIFIVLAMVSAMQIVIAYERGETVLEKDLRQYALMASPTFSLPLWNVDLVQTYLNMDGLLKGDNVYGVLILDDKGNEFASLGSILHKNNSMNCNMTPQIKGFSPTHNKNKCLENVSQFIATTERITNDNQLIGSITIYGNRDKIFQLIQPLVIATIISAIIIILALTIVSLVVTERQVGKPLRSLTQTISQLDYINISNTWSISKEFTHRQDELGELSKAFDVMVLELVGYQNHLEEIVAERTEKLRAANAIKSDFLSHMSHEIRTPINGVLGLAELMLSENHTPETLHRIDMIYSSGNYLLKIVNDILDLSKIEAGKFTIESIPICLKDFTHDIAVFFENQLKNTSVDMNIVIADNTPEYVFGDQLRLKQIVVNLLSNAFKFTEQGHIKFLIEPLSNNRLKFSITDTGIGIAADKIDALFQAFNQADTSTTRNFGGTGLGLTICKELIELMGGNIGATSTLRHGSCFYFTLPLPAANENIIAKPSLVTDKIQRIKNTVKILVAEDNLVNQAVIKGMLNKLSTTPVLKENGQQVIDYFHTNNPAIDVIFMDCEMPIVDGWEASQALRNRNVKRADSSPILIIGLSAHAVEGANQRALDAGMDDYLTKPLSMDALIAKLQQYDLLV